MNKLSSSLISLVLGIILTSCSSLEPIDTPPSTAPRTQLQKPADVLADVIKNYNETTTDCKEYGGTGRDRGHYYCSGVLVRTVDDGNFNPWMYSPTSLLIGASSYSWIRQDVHQTTLYHPAGFILRNRIDAVARDLPGLQSGFICLYPFDASTSTSNGHQGCGYRGKTAEEAMKGKETRPGGVIRPDDDNTAYAWGSCEGMGITTASGWDNHFASVGHQTPRQCSWNIDSQHGWNNMIASREDFPNLDATLWNEILLNNYGDGGQMPQYIAAYFYDVNRAGGLTAARNFQTRMNNAGYNVPILRLDFKAAAATRFSYVAADQAVPQ